MIISLRSLSYEDLKKQLAPEDKIALISCDTCIKFCGLGGSAMMKKLAHVLQADGYHVLGTDLVSIGCTVNMIERHRANTQKNAMYQEATVVIPLICQDGLEGVEHVFCDKKVIPIAKTVGIGNFTMDRGPVLTHPFEDTGLPVNPQGYTLAETAEKLGLYGGFFEQAPQSGKAEEKIHLTVNGQAVEGAPGQSLLSLCLEKGIDLPHLCYHEDLSEYGACRLCLVKIKGRKEFAAACCTRIQEGMEVVTEDEELAHCRQIILELLMASGRHDCLTCSKGVPTPMAACELQKLVRGADIHASRYEPCPQTKPEDFSSPVIDYDPNRCILCGRCVRACGEVSGMSNLGFVNRGDQTVVAAGMNTTFNQSDCAACMACVNVCPTGALNEKVVYYSGKDWTPLRKYMSL